MTLEFGRITLATISILYDIQDGGVRCASILRTICVTVSLHFRPTCEFSVDAIAVATLVTTIERVLNKSMVIH